MDQKFTSQYEEGTDVWNFANLLVYWKEKRIVNINSQWKFLKSFLKRSEAFQFFFEAGDFGSTVLKNYVSQLQQVEHLALPPPQNILKVGTLAFDIEFKHVMLDINNPNRFTLPTRGLGDNEGHLSNASRAFGSKTIATELRSQICPGCFVTDEDVAIFLAFGVSRKQATPAVRMEHLGGLEVGAVIPPIVDNKLRRVWEKVRIMLQLP